MNNLQKRRLLFLGLCIPTRLAMAYVAKTISPTYLPILGYVSLIPAIGFAYIFITGSRKVGLETFGEKIWWNNARPIHSLFYFAFAYCAIRQHKNAWQFLLYDVLFGLSIYLYTQ